MACFEQHRQHFAPQILCFYAFEQSKLSGLGLLFVCVVAFFERTPIEVVQIRHITWREQCPFTVHTDTLHKQIRYPVGGVHVMGATPVVPCVLTQLEEFFDVEMPGFQIRTDRPFALATLINRDGGVVDDFQKWHDTLRFAVGALYVGTECSHRGPVVTKAPGPFR